MRPRASPSVLPLAQRRPVCYSRTSRVSSLSQLKWLEVLRMTMASGGLLGLLSWKERGQTHVEGIAAAVQYQQISGTRATETIQLCPHGPAIGFTPAHWRALGRSFDIHILVATILGMWPFIFKNSCVLGGPGAVSWDGREVPVLGRGTDFFPWRTCFTSARLVSWCFLIL